MSYRIARKKREAGTVICAISLNVVISLKVSYLVLIFKLHLNITPHIFEQKLELKWKSSISTMDFEVLLSEHDYRFLIKFLCYLVLMRLITLQEISPR